jgi:hypothetical protein
MQPHLFLLRVWLEELDESSTEWRGRVKSLHSGEVRHFRDPQTLYTVLLRMLEELNEAILDEPHKEEE